MILSCMLAFAASADVIIPRGEGARPQHSKDFSFEQFQQEKCDFITQELELSEADAKKFLPVYKQLLQEKSVLYHKYGGSHRVMRLVSEGHQMPDSVMQNAAQNARQLQVEDAKLEQEYLTKFEKVLTPTQIIKLQEAEQKFKNEMMKRGPRRHSHR